MAKGKTRTGVPNKHLHARISFLQQAATYLAMQSERHGVEELRQPAKHTMARNELEQDLAPQPTATVPQHTPSESATFNKEEANRLSSSSRTSAQRVYATSASGGLPQHLTTHLRQVAQKSTILLHPSIKHTLCRTCSAVLIPGQTCRKYVENLSRGGAKAHADVLVLACDACGAVKRFPVGARRQGRKGVREQGRVVREGEGEGREGDGGQVTAGTGDG